MKRPRGRRRVAGTIEECEHERIAFGHVTVFYLLMYGAIVVAQRHLTK